MGYTTDYNLPQMPSGPVDWPAFFNDLTNKVEAGRTLKLNAAATIVKGKCFYIDSNGKAAISDANSDIVGVWQTASTGAGTDGYGQVDGTMSDGGWSWTPGANLYSNSSGVLTETPSSSLKIVAVALSATKIVINKANIGGGNTYLDGRDSVDNYAANLTLDYNTSASHWIELTANTTITISNMNDGGRMVVILKQGSGGSKLVSSWVGVDYWQGGNEPTLTTTAAHFDIVTLVKSNSKVFAAATLDFS